MASIGGGRNAPSFTLIKVERQDPASEHAILTRREYDSPLVCALAVLGVKEDGWKGPEQYPPILSAVIKIARFMVVQKGLEMSGPEEDSGDETDDLDDSAYESGPSQRRRPKGVCS
ncbi:PRP38-assoc multi-domain protein [Pyrenophora tritici-repentis]|nr:PRP38-assoc multi-domain protein [Pyrenophora tritici-repentis]